MRRFLCMLVIFVGAAFWAAPALAYDETGAGRPCIGCHGAETVDPDAENAGRQGPHGNYTASTAKCQACHSVHEASPDGYVLLPKATVKANCEVCHDGTGGAGVYGVIKARTGVDPVADHSIDATTLIPGGETDGTDGSTIFSGVAGQLTCSDCHSPHGTNTVDPFLGDRRRETTAAPTGSDGTGTTGFTSSRLLKKRPTSGTSDVQKYGSDWCASCHKGRMDGAAVFNHPVESVSDDPVGYFHYDNVQLYSGPGTTVAGKLGRSNRGYVMPYPYTAGQGAHVPICQQCHEDGRNVGDVTQGRIDPTEEFTSESIDGTTTGNPTFHTFPHESDNSRLLVETADDLCTNCHDPANQLP